MLSDRIVTVPDASGTATPKTRRRSNTTALPSVRHRTLTLFKPLATHPNHKLVHCDAYGCTRLAVYGYGIAFRNYCTRCSAAITHHPSPSTNTNRKTSPHDGYARCVCTLAASRTHRWWLTTVVRGHPCIHAG